MSILNVVVTGASGAGKTTLVQGLDGYALTTGHRVKSVRRLVTRNQRLGETPSESDFVDVDRLQWLVGAGLAPFVWRRSFGDRDEWYGFRRPGESDVVVFSGNDALVHNLDRFVRRFPTKLLHVILTCPQGERERRLQNRSPDLWLDPGQIETRLAPALVTVDNQLMTLQVPSIDAATTLRTVVNIVESELRRIQAVPGVDLSLTLEPHRQTI